MLLDICLEQSVPVKFGAIPSWSDFKGGKNTAFHQKKIIAVGKKKKKKKKKKVKLCSISG